MNKSNLFKAAHKLTKEVRKAGDSYQVTFGACLKFIRGGGLKSFTDFCLALVESTFRVDGELVGHLGFSSRSRRLDKRAYSKKEWRRLLQALHPDKEGGNTEYFSYFSEVYSVIKRHLT